jgi:hypothetical protein
MVPGLFENFFLRSAFVTSGVMLGLKLSSFELLKFQFQVPPNLLGCFDPLKCFLKKAPEPPSSDLIAISSPLGTGC